MSQVEVEGADRAQNVGRAAPRAGLLEHHAVGLPFLRGLRGDAQFPGGGDRGCQAQRVDPGMMRLEIGPEQPAERVGQPDQRDVVEADLAFAQVVDEQITYRLAGDATTIDQLLDGELPVGCEGAQVRCRVRAEHPGRAQQLVEVWAAVVRDVADLARDREQFQTVTGGDLADGAALGCEDRRDAVQRDPRRGLPDRAGLAGRHQGGEAGRVAGAGHLAGQPFGRDRGQQPGQRGAQHVGADQ